MSTEAERKNDVGDEIAAVTPSVNHLSSKRIYSVAAPGLHNDLPNPKRTRQSARISAINAKANAIYAADSITSVVDNGSDTTADANTGTSSDSESAASIASGAQTDRVFNIGEFAGCAPDKPAIYANVRGALAESVDYFRCHEGGNYHHDKITHGLFIDAKVTDRDYMDGSVIITSIGGGNVRDPKTGAMTRKTSQDKKARFWRYLNNSLRKDQAVVVVMGGKYPKCPIGRAPYQYCVMGHFRVTDIWSEVTLNAKKVRISYWMVRLEKVPSSGPSWWVAGTTDDSHSFTVGENVCTVQECAKCGVESKLIYRQGWTCLNETCVKQFQFAPTVAPETAQYNLTFLRERTDHSTLKPLVPLVPTLPTFNPNTDFGIESEFKGGICCPMCRCCSRRVYWDHWRCENENCDFAYKPESRKYPIEEVRKETKRHMGNGRPYVDKKVVQNWETDLSGYSAEVYTFPNEDGKVIGAVTVCRATTEICAKTNGPDELFQSMQDKDLKLKRNAARNPGQRNEELCSHFVSNWGAHYKYGVFVETNGFDSAPDEILRGVAQLTWAQEQAIEAIRQCFQENDIEYSQESMSMESRPFNELLSLGYMQSSLIHYHDDGEKELGPTVATLSLGSPAVMRFRPKKKTTIGTVGNNKELLRMPVVSFTLNHGDIVIMHGTEIHKFYEHEVIPRGKLRFALTSRFIRPDSIKDPKTREEAIVKGKLPEGIETLAYRGVDTNEATDEDYDMCDIGATAEASNINAEALAESIVNNLTGFELNTSTNADASEAMVFSTTNNTDNTVAVPEAMNEDNDGMLHYANDVTFSGVEPLAPEDELLSRFIEVFDYLEINEGLIERLSPEQCDTLVSKCLKTATVANQARSRSLSPDKA
ncbi:hypothetical protein BJ170DRAFT_720338 [Xylariales sp. AK1849]|nr:hypothetical protein BJ170DRAFT_720338 [Xylariales sp. AK1849]